LGWNDKPARQQLPPPYFSWLNNRKILVVIGALTVALIADTEVGIIADFIPEWLASSEGKALFVTIAAIFAASGFLLLAFVRQKIGQSNIKSLHLNIVHNIVTVLQYSLIAIVAFVVLQVLQSQPYAAMTLGASVSISYMIYIAMLALLARALLSWYISSMPSRRNVMVLILGLAMAATLVNAAGGLAVFLAILQQQPSEITPDYVAFFPQFEAGTLLGELQTWYQIAAGVAYILTWIGTVMLLRPFVKKLGKIKFWSIMSAALVYYLVQIPLFMLGWYTPTEETNMDIMNNIVIFAAASIFTGVVFGAAFLSVARTLKKDSPVRNYMIIAAYGLLLLYVSGSGMVSQAAYPPFGLVSVSFVGLASYMIYVGLYYSAIAVSQDNILRQSIKKSVLRQSKLLDTIGTAEMERELQGQVLKMVKNNAKSISEETGVKTSMTEDEVKDYMEAVIQELQSKKPEK
jgi:hypothetical protein